MNKLVEKLIADNGGVLSTANALSAGLSKATLSALVREGRIERVARGQYILPDELPDELYLWQLRMPRMVYSHETALFLHDLAERTPPKYTVTLPSDVRLSAAFPGDIKVYMIKPELFDVGIVSLPSKMGHYVWAYSAERTICDILRSRNKIDNQTVVTAMRNYADRPTKDMKTLGQYAALFRVTKILRQYLEVLL